jgi:tetratricopeptide (TPR) repeat protein
MTKIFSQVLIFSFFTLTSCYCQTAKIIYNPKAIELNNKAVEFIKIKKLDSALIYLDKAIKIDTTYYLAYGNKCTVYCTLKDFKNALLVAEKEITVKPDLAEGWTFAGMLNDKLGDTINAVRCYKKSIELFDERISNPNKQKYLKANKINRALSYILSGQQETGQNEIKKLMEIYPNDESLESFSKLSKQDFLNQLFNTK